jgi:CheY-like chemotaxis protein
MRILFVDDDMVNLILAKKLLTKFNLEFSLAKNGKEALEQLKSQSFDLLLLDLYMPEIDGFEVLENIKGNNQNQYPDMRIIILTADEMPDTIDRVKKFNVEFMPKPLSIGSLERILDGEKF